MRDVNDSPPTPRSVVPTGELLTLRPGQLRPNRVNPRRLFDPKPMADLKANIRLHGVLVPITVFQAPGSKKFDILDGARRHRCCQELADEGIDVLIPANVVQPPDQLASVLYMFSIHNFREQWELMPTALSLKWVIDKLGDTDNEILANVTGLSEPQVERCKKLLDVPESLQQLSLDPDPKTRIPSNFWIEAHPVVTLVAETLPARFDELRVEGVLRRFVAKYRAGKIKSVIHFRRIVEAFEINEAQTARLVKTLEQFLDDETLETRQAFDDFVVDSRRAQGAERACEIFQNQLMRARLEHVVDDRERVMAALRNVQQFVASLLTRLEGDDPPPAGNDSEGVSDDEP